MMKNFIILFLLFQYSALFGQVKFEYEIAVNSTEVPVKCTDFIGQLNFASDVRWIKERSQLGTSYEAKFSFEKTIYSIEFDSLGSHLDTEIDVKDLPQSLRNATNASLSKAFKKFKIKRTQLQLIGEEKIVIEALNQKEYSRMGITQNYELILRGKKDKHNKLYECLIDSSGNLMSILQIVTPPSDNLEF